MSTKLSLALAVLALGAATPALAASLVVPMALATPTGPGAVIGQVTVSDAPGGVTFTLDLHGLTPGPHGFHVHANPSCAQTTNDQGVVAPAGGAGGHFDPAMTKMHMGPMGMGHEGDLPLITAAADGTVKATVKAPHLATTADVKGHALMVHAGGDNYADAPAPLGGGGARFACGVAQ
jgi:Cu-Zn family superoxide dismutase